MATAIKFWRGSFVTFNSKVTGSTLSNGTLYFINEGALYLATGANTYSLISPQRLSVLTAATDDAVSTATAKAIVDFVKDQIDGAFADGSAYATAIKGLQDSIDALNLATEGYTGQGAIKTAVDAKLDASTYNTAMAGISGTVADAIATSKGEAIEAAQGLTVNGQTFGADNVIVLTANDIKLEDTVGAATVKKELEDIRTIASAAMTFKGVVDTVDGLPSTDVENGDIYYVKADDTEYVYITDSAYGPAGWEALGGYVKADVYTKGEVDAELAKKVDNTVKVNGKALSGDVTLVADDIADVYSKTEVDGAIDADVKTAKDAIDAYTVNGKAISENPVLTGSDINVSSSDTTKIDAKFTSIQEQIDAITGTGEEGGATTIAGLAAQISALQSGKVDKTTTVNGKALSGNITLVAADIEDVYSKTEVDNMLSWIEGE